MSWQVMSIENKLKLLNHLPLRLAYLPHSFPSFRLLSHLKKALILQQCVFVLQLKIVNIIVNTF